MVASKAAMTRWEQRGAAILRLTWYMVGLVGLGGKRNTDTWGVPRCPEGIGSETFTARRVDASVADACLAGGAAVTYLSGISGNFAVPGGISGEGMRTINQVCVWVSPKWTKTLATSFSKLAKPVS